MHVARADGRHPVGRRRCRTRSSTASSRPSTACRRRTSPARCSGSSIGSWRRRARRSRSVAFDFWQQFDAAEELEELRMFDRPAIYKALPCAERAMIVNQWVPAAHQRRCDRRQRAPRCAICCAAMGHESELYALTDGRRPRRRGAAVRATPAAAQRRRHDLPLRAAVADDRGVRDARSGRARPAVPQRDAGVVLRAVRSGAVPAGGARPRRSSRRWPDASTWRSASPSTTGASSRRSASRRPACCRWPSTLSRDHAAGASGRRSTSSWTTSS